MEDNHTIDLKDLTNDGVIANLSGRLRGLAAKEKYNLDWTDANDIEELVVRIPKSLNSVTPSFVQGMFGDTLKVLGSDESRFFETFTFVAPDFIKDQIKEGVIALTTSRDLKDLFN